MFLRKRFEKLCYFIENGNTTDGLSLLKHMLASNDLQWYQMGFFLTKQLYLDKKKVRPYWDMFLKYTESYGGHGLKQSEYAPMYTLYFLKEYTYEVIFKINKQCFLNRTIRLELEVIQSEDKHSISGVRPVKLQSTEPDTFRYSLKFLNSNWLEDPHCSFALNLSGSANVVVYSVAGSEKSVILRESFNLDNFES